MTTSGVYQGRGVVRWVSDVTADELSGYEVVEWPGLYAEAGEITLARGSGVRRTRLESPVAEWFSWLREADAVAVVGVVLDSVRALEDLVGFVIEPAIRCGVALLVCADAHPDDLDDAAFVEPAFGYPYSLDRLRWLLRSPQQVREAPEALPDTEFAPDEQQALAVHAGGGVVQIIAPAGSGKSTVLVERVRELRRRGVPARRIICVTFNRAAAGDLRVRLKRAGVGDVSARTFHGLGRMLLEAEGRLPDNIDPPTLAQWRRLAARAKAQVGKDGVWLDPGEAQTAVSDVKLGKLMSAEQYASTITEETGGRERTVAELYRLHEDLMREQSQYDYDDLILRALLLLREDHVVRERWQGRFEQFLVDEYQDIEPAQELLVRLLAAPEDQLFCVGDEDQTLYAFRRASVERIILLDQLYPGLQRVPLETNYRCPPLVVAASSRLISVNRVRFPKSISHGGHHDHAGVINLVPVSKPGAAAGDIARVLATRTRADIAVLARTSNLLRPVALACADQGVPIDGPDKLFEATGARRALAQHLQLALAPGKATADLVSGVCRTPSRGLPDGQAQPIAEQLQAGASFEEAFAKVPAPTRGRGKLLAPGTLFAQLRVCVDAAEAVRLLRGAGGLDDWFSQADGLGSLDPCECEALERAQADAAALTPQQLLAHLNNQAQRLKAIRARGTGIELATIHGSKGRQWPHVIVVGCDEGQLPHSLSQQVSAAEERRGEGTEAERRLAYVAFTRAGHTLELHYDKERPSTFLREAGLIARPRVQRPRPRKTPRTRERPAPAARTPPSPAARTRPEPTWPPAPEHGRPPHPSWTDPFDPNANQQTSTPRQAPREDERPPAAVRPAHPAPVEPTRSLLGWLKRLFAPRL
ncbi:MAG: UvrD-helicase domain-containing protein [Tepidisphaeraceae bacterium]